MYLYFIFFLPPLCLHANYQNKEWSTKTTSKEWRKTILKKSEHNSKNRFVKHFSNRLSPPPPTYRPLLSRNVFWSQSMAEHGTAWQSWGRLANASRFTIYNMVIMNVDWMRYYRKISGYCIYKKTFHYLWSSNSATDFHFVHIPERCNEPIQDQGSAKRVRRCWFFSINMKNSKLTFPSLNRLNYYHNAPIS